jgi:hypothetical protein
VVWQLRKAALCEWVTALFKASGGTYSSDPLPTRDVLAGVDPVDVVDTLVVPFMVMAGADAATTDVAAAAVGVGCGRERQLTAVCWVSRRARRPWPG